MIFSVICYLTNIRVLTIILSAKIEQEISIPNIKDFILHTSPKRLFKLCINIALFIFN